MADAAPWQPRRPAPDGAKRHHWLAAGVRSRREICGARDSEPVGRASPMERLRDVRMQLQAWERAFRRRHGRRPGKVRAARGREAEAATPE